MMIQGTFTLPWVQVSEETLRRECGFFEPVDLSDTTGALKEEGEVLAAYKSEGNPAEYLDAYKALTAFVEKSLDVYKVIIIIIYSRKVQQNLE